VAPKVNERPVRADYWMLWANQKPVVPMTFVVGKEDETASAILAGVLVNSGIGRAEVIPDTDQTGQQLLEKDAKMEKRVQTFITKSLKALQYQMWVPRRLKTLRSYWQLPADMSKFGTAKLKMDHYYLAKRPGEEGLRPIPLERFYVNVKGLKPRARVVPGKND
jgi:hypothetical protein